MHQFYDDFHQLVENAQAQAKDQEQDDMDVLGVCPDTGAQITTGVGRFGHYVKLNTDKAKFANIPKHIDYKNIDLDTALSLLTLPRILGQFNGHDLVAAYGKNGGYIKCNNMFINLKAGEPEKITLDIAIDLYRKKKRICPMLQAVKVVANPLRLEMGNGVNGTLALDIQSAGISKKQNLPKENLL